MIVFNRFKGEEHPKSFGDDFLPLAVRIYSVYRDDTEFLTWICFRHLASCGGMHSIVEASFRVNA
jgi:hypothetical protein